MIAKVTGGIMLKKKSIKNIKHTAKNILKNKKQLAYLAVLLVLVVTVAVETVIIFNLNNIPSNNDKIISSSERVQANRLKSLATEALNNKQFAQSKAFYEEAKRQYEIIGDNNNITDINAQLNIVEYYLNNQ